MRSAQRVVITGAAGKLGRSFLRTCVDAGFPVLAVIRPGQDVSGIVTNESDIFVTDVNDDWELFARGLASTDCVVHFAASMSGKEMYVNTLSTTGSLLKATEFAGVKNIVLVSSISVLDYSASKEKSKIDESSPVCACDQYLGEYARMKRDQESLVDRWVHAETERRGVILRAGLVYDETDISADHAGLTIANKTICVTHTGQVPLIHLDSLCDAIKSVLELISKTESQSQILHLIDDQTLTQPEYIERLKLTNSIRCIAAVNWKNYLGMTRFLSKLMAFFGMGSRIPDQLRQNSVAGRNKPFVFSNAAATKCLNWTPKSRL